MATKRQARQPAGKAAGPARKMIIMDRVMARRLAALAAWQGRSESSIVAEALRPILADVAVTGGSMRSQSSDPNQQTPSALRVAEPDAA